MTMTLTSGIAYATEIIDAKGRLPDGFSMELEAINFANTSSFS